MKNPFYTTITFTAVLTILVTTFLLLGGINNYVLTDFQVNILVGILSSTLLLMLIEIFNYLKDKNNFGSLGGRYKRIEIHEENENGIRGTNDTCYTKLEYYDCANIIWNITLEYRFNGIYVGTAEYYNHKEHQKKSIVKLTLNLNLANPMIGTGSYKYVGIDDYGKYEFQVDDDNKKRIIVSYENTIPSGLANGYEIWERVN